MKKIVTYIIFLFVLAMLLTVIIGIGIGNAGTSKREHSEKYYQEKYCPAGPDKTDVVLSDRTRVDCLTDEYAIEFDFANKWAESIGQSMHYALMTGKKPGIYLIMENPVKDQKYLKRLKKALDSIPCFNPEIWIVP